jgi:hypothetical protein
MRVLYTHNINPNPDHQHIAAGQPPRVQESDQFNIYLNEIDELYIGLRTGHSTNLQRFGVLMTLYTGVFAAEQLTFSQRLDLLMAATAVTAVTAVTATNLIQGELNRQVRIQPQAVPLPVQNHGHPPPSSRSIDAHEHALNVSVNNSLKRLDARYSSLDIPATLQALQSHIQTLPPGSQKQAAQSCLDRVQSITELHDATGFTLAKILALTWHAANDHAVGDTKEGMPAPLKSEHIKLRQAAIIERMVQAQTDQDGSAVCFIGNIVRIVEGLSKAHEDVAIVYDIKELAWIKILNFSNEELSKLPKSNQQRILRTWDDEGQTEANAFKEDIKSKIRDMLNAEFKDLIMPHDINNLLRVKFEYLPQPISHPDLLKLKNIFDENEGAGTIPRERIFCGFSAKFRQALIDKDYDYNAVYQVINEKYTEFSRLDKFLQKLQSLNDSNINSAIAVAYLKYLGREPVDSIMQMVRHCAAGVIQHLQPANQSSSSTSARLQRVQEIEAALIEDSATPASRSTTDRLLSYFR